MPAMFASGIAAETKIPHGMTGLVRRQTLRGSVIIARALMPSLKRIALVGDVPRPQNVRAHFKEEIPALATEVEIIDLRGLRMAELRQRVAALPDETVIYFTTLTFEGDRPAYVSRDALVAIAEVANRPIIVDLESHVGCGSVGGLVADPARSAAKRRALPCAFSTAKARRTFPSSRRICPADFRLAAAATVEHQREKCAAGKRGPLSQPSAWEQYHWQIMLIAAALLLQTGMIIGLFHEHRRRRVAEGRRATEWPSWPT